MPDERVIKSGLTIWIFQKNIFSKQISSVNPSISGLQNAINFFFLLLSNFVLNMIASKKTGASFGSRNIAVYALTIENGIKNSYLNEDFIVNKPVNN